MQVDFRAKTADLTTRPGRTLTSEECARAFQGSPYRVKRFAPLD